MPDQTTLLTVITRACSYVVGARVAAAELLETKGRSTSCAVAPDGARLDRTTALRLPVRYGGQLLGALWVEPTWGRTLRRRDLLVLNGFSEQAGVAFRNLHLDAELDREVRELATTVEQLETARQETITARAHETKVLQSAINTTVLPRLRTARTARTALSTLALNAANAADAVDDVGAADAAGHWAGIDAAVNDAKPELRQVSHGLRSRSTPSA